MLYENNNLNNNMWPSLKKLSNSEPSAFSRITLNPVHACTILLIVLLALLTKVATCTY